MKLAEKIVSLRRKNGWSQDELAAQLGVSRQSVSKWEGGQSMPDIQRIVELGRIFDVSTDYLLKDGEDESDNTIVDVREKEYECVSVNEVSAGQADEFMYAMKKQGLRTAIGTVLCILSPIPLLMMAVFSENGLIFSENMKIHSEGALAASGMAAFLVMISIAVVLFITGSAFTRPWKFIRDGEFSISYETREYISDMDKEQTYSITRTNALACALCVISPLPLIIAGCMQASGSILIICTALILVFVATAVYFFITVGMVRSSFDQLLKCGDYSPKNEKKRRIEGVYWSAVTAVYLAWSFITMKWAVTWIIWPVAGCVYGVIEAYFGWKDD